MKIKHILLVLLTLLLLSSCHNDNDEKEKTNIRTIFMYMPWSSNLISEFATNLSDFETAIEQMGGLDNKRLIVYHAGSTTTGNLYEIVCENGECVRQTIKSYTDIDCTQESVLTGIINDVKTVAPAQSYSMIISGHGTGWLPAGTEMSKKALFAKSYSASSDELKTRYFGGLTSDTQTNISTLVNSLSNNNIKLDYLMFDDCYMSSLEVAYELRTVTNYLIACPTEIMAYGMPYEEIGAYLLSDTPNYNAICQAFITFYSSYKDSTTGKDAPYGTIAVTDCSQLDELAEMVKYANSTYVFDSKLLPNIQRMDGYSPTIFYDFGDYIRALCAGDDTFIAQIDELLSKVVPLKAHTDSFYSMRQIIPISSYSGLTTSACSESSAASDYENTSWYKATH